jgi:catechol 2,3-dioxygenase-like lactoylglutathione lyase family enzyme
MIKTFGLTHTALPVADLDRSIAFYGKLLGAEVRYRSADSADIGTPGCHDVVTLQQSKNGDAVGEMGALGHIGFRLQKQEDVEAVAAAVVAAGGTVTDKGRFTPDEPYVFAKDPDGYVIELWYEP